MEFQTRVERSGSGAAGSGTVAQAAAGAASMSRRLIAPTYVEGELGTLRTAVSRRKGERVDEPSHRHTRCDLQYLQAAEEGVRGPRAVSIYSLESSRWFVGARRDPVAVCHRLSCNSWLVSLAGCALVPPPVHDERSTAFRLCRRKEAVTRRKVCLLLDLTLSAPRTESQLKLQHSHTP